MNGLRAAALCLALGGCAGGIAGFEPEVVGGGAGLPQTLARSSQEVVTPPPRRLVALAVRTYRPEAGELVEVAAACSVRAGAFGAELATPGRLVMPDLGPDAPAVEALCRQGALTGANAVTPLYAWADTGGGPLERIAWGGGWWYGDVRSGPMRYPDLLVGLQ